MFMADFVRQRYTSSDMSQFAHKLIQPYLKIQHNHQKAETKAKNDNI